MIPYAGKKTKDFFFMAVSLVCFKICELWQFTRGNFCYKAQNTLCVHTAHAFVYLYADVGTCNYL